MVKMIPPISRLPRGGGWVVGCHGDPPPSPMDLKSDCMKEIAHFKTSSFFIIKALCQVDSSDIYK